MVGTSEMQIFQLHLDRVKEDPEHCQSTRVVELHGARVIGIANFLHCRNLASCEHFTCKKPTPKPNSWSSPYSPVAELVD